MITNWNWFERIWFGTFLLIGFGLSLLWDSTWFQYSVFLFGIICVVLTAKGSIWSFVFGLYNSVGYGWIAMQNGLYGEMGLNWFFFVPTAVIGFMMWRGRMDGVVVQMRKLSPRLQLNVGLVSLLAVVAMGFGLSLIEMQNTPYIDALTNVLSVVATLLTMWRYREQWLVYILLNIFTIFMWTYRLIDGSEGALLMIVMWSAYLINACYGYYNWSKGAALAARKESY
jgi:nicotinamide mononucleotide transporter